LKASILYVHTNSFRLYDILHFAAFTAGLIHLKKPSVGRRPYWSPMPWGHAMGLTFHNQLYTLKEPLYLTNRSLYDYGQTGDQ
jgi:hypothetical protein